MESLLGRDVNKQGGHRVSAPAHCVPDDYYRYLGIEKPSAGHRLVKKKNLQESERWGSEPGREERGGSVFALLRNGV